MFTQGLHTMQSLSVLTVGIFPQGAFNKTQEHFPIILQPFFIQEGHCNKQICKLLNTWYFILSLTTYIRNKLGVKGNSKWEPINQMCCRAA